jgi:sensor histidine kinase YesM
MIRLIRLIFPGKLRTKLMSAFFMCVLLPLSILTAYAFIRLERSLVEKIAEQTRDNLEYLKNEFEDTRVSLQNIFLVLSHDREIQNILQHPEFSDDRNALLEARLNETDAKISPVMGKLRYTVYDRFGLRYSPNSGDLVSEAGGSEYIENENGGSTQLFVFFGGTDASFHWIRLSETQQDSSGYALSLFSAIVNNEGYTIGYIQIDYPLYLWITMINDRNIIKRNYCLIDETGKVLIKTSIKPDGSIMDKIHINPYNGYYVSKDSSLVVNHQVIPSFNWYLVSQLDLNMFFGDFHIIRWQITIFLIIITVVFILITCLITILITHPLYILGQRMKNTVSGNFLVNIPESDYDGEILEVTRAFNQMIYEMSQLIETLKAEERQKENLRFQVRLNQLKPHFLLNTLNSIKWIAMEKNIDSIADICVSLGKLLESSLDSEKEFHTLKEEMELVSAYVRIQKYRFGKKLRYRCEYDPVLDNVIIPRLSLQPLVENAVQHGFSGIKIVVIRIRAFLQDGFLVMNVEDNGSGLNEPENRGRKGIGLENLSERLRLYYKGQAKLALEVLRQGVLVTIRIPCPFQ